MLLGCCYFHVFFLLANADLVFNNDQANATDALFSDVIKNISRVNSVLQELIKNYEQLQNMYKAHSLEADYSSDSEIDEVYKNSKNNRKPRTYNDTTPPVTMKNFPGTGMLLSEEESEDITEKSNFLDDDKRAPSIQSLQAPDLANNNKIEDKETNEDHKDNESVRDHKHSDEVKVPDNVFYDNFHQKHSNKNEKSLKHKHKETAQESGKEIYLTTTVNVQGNARNVQKVVHTETFNQEKIWNEIVNKKPIQLRTHRKMPFDTKRDMMRQSHLNNKKTAIVFVTKNKDLESKEDSSASITEEEKEINKELFKSNILRVAYGDACLKVVLKKCSKALKQVGKTVCRATKCKSDFKKKFKDLSKTGCIKEFNQMNSTTSYRVAGNENTFVDATRVGLEDCFPIMKPLITLRNDTPPAHKEDSELNILRDRYERACQKASSAKCDNACRFAYKGACDKYECSKSKKKYFNKYCKRQCKLAYKSHRNKKRKSSESSRSSSSSESDSGSGSDSDSASKSK